MGVGRMSVILLVLGIVMALAGIASAGFGIPINEFMLGTTLIIAGTTALTGGLILIGLAAVVSELARVAEGLKGRTTATRPAARATESEPAPAIPAETPAIARSLHEVIPAPSPPSRPRSE